MAEIQEFKCPCCGGSVEFNSDIQKMQCPYCDSEFDAEALKEANKNNVIGKGIAASPGAAAGTIVFTAEDAVVHGKKGEKEKI